MALSLILKKVSYMGRLRDREEASDSRSVWEKNIPDFRDGWWRFLG